MEEGPSSPVDRHFWRAVWPDLGDGEAPDAPLPIVQPPWVGQARELPPINSAPWTREELESLVASAEDMLRLDLKPSSVSGWDEYLARNPHRELPDRSHNALVYRYGRYVQDKKSGRLMGDDGGTIPVLALPSKRPRLRRYSEDEMASISNWAEEILASGKNPSYPRHWEIFMSDRPGTDFYGRTSNALAIQYSSKLKKVARSSTFRPRVDDAAEPVPPKYDIQSAPKMIRLQMVQPEQELRATVVEATRTEHDRLEEPELPRPKSSVVEMSSTNQEQQQQQQQQQHHHLKQFLRKRAKSSYVHPSTGAIWTDAEEQSLVVSGEEMLSLGMSVKYAGSWERYFQQNPERRLPGRTSKAVEGRYIRMAQKNQVAAIKSSLGLESGPENEQVAEKEEDAMESDVSLAKKPKHDKSRED